MKMLLLVHLAATLTMVGLIWFVQVVHYPLMSRVGVEGATAYASRHQQLITWVVGPPMLTEAVTGMLLIRQQADLQEFGWFLASLFALLLIWGSTACLQIPCHHRLSQAFEPVTHRRLVRTNWIRTAAWTFRGLAVSAVVASHLT